MKIKIPSILLLFFQLLITSLYFGAFNIDFGFAFKPYMLITAINAIIFIRYVRFGKLFLFEWFMLFFIVFYSMTALRFNFPLNHLRFILAFLVILFFYFVNRSLIERIQIHKLEKTISYAGLIGVSASIIYYIFGLLSTGLNYYGNNIIYFGLILDRSIPRLIGTVSNDPNIFVFFVTLYFIYTLCNLDSFINKIGFFLSGISIVLSFSRGAYVAILLTLLVLFFIDSDKKKKLKGLIYISISLSLFIVISSFFSLNVIEVIQNRFSDISLDGGSGRNVLWANAFQTFMSHPLFGIGINSTTSYGLINYNDGHYVHNTILEVLSESGIFGLSLFVLFWVTIFWKSIKLFKINKHTKFIFITFIAMFFQMIFLSILFSEAFYFMLVILYRYSTEYLENKNVYAENMNTA